MALRTTPSGVIFLHQSIPVLYLELVQGSDAPPGSDGIDEGLPALDAHSMIYLNNNFSSTFRLIHHIHQPRRLQIPIYSLRHRQ